MVVVVAKTTHSAMVYGGSGQWWAVVVSQPATVAAVSAHPTKTLLVAERKRPTWLRCSQA
jgi:hypothetical protein